MTDPGPRPIVVADDRAGRARAIAVLRAGGVVGLPTDTVYGIGTALAMPGGIERLFALKGRPPERGIVLLLADATQAATIGLFGPAAVALAAAGWPGGLTLVVPIRPGVELPAVLTGGGSTIGLRVPDHAAPRALAAAIGPFPVTSANRSGEPEGPDGRAVAALFGDGLDLVLDDGPASGGPPSTVVAAEGITTRILRSGALPAAQIEAILAAAGLPPPSD